MSQFIGTNQQLINCLQLIADTRTSSQRDTSILIEAADRLRDFCRTELPALIAERDALREALREIKGGAALAAGMSVNDGPVFAAIRDAAHATLESTRHDAK